MEEPIDSPDALICPARLGVSICHFETYVVFPPPASFGCCPYQFETRRKVRESGALQALFTQHGHRHGACYMKVRGILVQSKVQLI